MAVSFTERLLIAMYYCILGVTGLFASVTLMIVLYKHRDYRYRPSTCYLYSILLASVLACLYEIPYYVFSILANLPPPNAGSYDTECKISLFLTYSISTVKVFLLCALSLDRFIAIIYPYFYSKYATRMRIRIANILLWILPMLLVIPLSALDNASKYIGLIGVSCGVDWTLIDKNYMIFLIVVAFITPSTVVAITNIKVFLVARRQKRIIATEIERYDNRPREVVLGDGFVVESISKATENVHDGKEVRSEKNHSMGTEFLQSTPGRQQLESNSVSNQEGSFVLKGNVPKGYEHGRSSEEKSGTLTDSLSVGSETKREKPRESFALTEEKHPISQSYLGNRTLDIKHKNSGSSRKKSLQSTDWGIVFSTLMLVAVFFVTWSPFGISRIYEAFTKFLDTRTILYTSAITLLDIILNPLIIIVTRVKLREEYKKLFCFK